MTKVDHAERTAHEPRDPSLHKTILERVDEINATIRTFRLFLPGQWLDVFVPGISKPGGFTITSPPSRAQGTPLSEEGGSPYLELAVQRSPENAVASWLWRPAVEIVSSEIWVRVGGSFVWPPPGVVPTTLRKLVFIAGGVGINPLMSIIAHLAEQPNSSRHRVEVLYSMRDPGEGSRDPRKLLFVSRLAKILGQAGEGDGQVQGRLTLFLTRRDGEGEDSGGRIDGDDVKLDGLDLTFEPRRITIEDIKMAIGADRRFCVVYVCGLPDMTDEYVEKLTSPAGMSLEPHRVLYEKWW
ncbi:hypothetical protein M406DRAFT_336304 [Cryphonectria parasitica EP155]|uniref:FAD-binding FR-type domain-containing protein n=1 Tax=Cryphonectria parasitica (strain ATCC 38755 / EP155) TaxID=660469 RepID=A0A9P4YCR4_CRYP1|nr:uncharacterized protein M406DRAFT_336304 [Cryphonectria parasitica EP155]KAF3770693.1 hypothetical protein M406DRAFT_336304 [Cryphonectria parasitica EP155]